MTDPITQVDLSALYYWADGHPGEWASTLLDMGEDDAAWHAAQVEPPYEAEIVADDDGWMLKVRTT